MAACDVRGLMGRVKRVEIESPSGADCRASVFPFHHSLSGLLALWSNYQEVSSFIQSWRSSEHELGVLWARCLNSLPSRFVCFCILYAICSSPP
jgi:hypothetical protein